MRVAGTIKTELQDRGVRLTDSAGGASTVSIALSENWKELVWTGEVRQGDATHLVILGVPRDPADRSASNSMHVTVRSEKFWEGPKHILDATEVHRPSKSWLLLLLPSIFEVQDLQTGLSSMIDISAQYAGNRDPWGEIGVSPLSETTFSTGYMACVVDLNLEPPALENCGPEGPTIRFSLLPPLPGDRIDVPITAVCGGTASKSLMTGPRDYTQTDTLQVFQMESGGPVAMSAELNFPGPILALHIHEFGVPTAIVRNLTTGNYEAYHLAISCAE